MRAVFAVAVLIAAPVFAQEAEPVVVEFRERFDPVTTSVEPTAPEEDQAAPAGEEGEAEWGAFDLSSLGGVEESTAANGARVRRPLGEEPAGSLPAAPDVSGAAQAQNALSFEEALARRRQEAREQRARDEEYGRAEVVPGEQSPAVSENCRETATGFTCSVRVVSGSEENNSRAQEALDRLLGDDD